MALTTAPTFLVIGAQKCGTTWLAEMVRQHPEVVVARVKELHFFDNRENYRRGLDWYRSQFPLHAGARAAGEFTPNYFWTSDGHAELDEGRCKRDIPRLVHAGLPELKLIVCLRDPVERAVSAYFHHIRQGRISDKQRLAEVAHRFGIETMGFYDEHLRNWMEYFPADQFLVLIYELDLRDENKRSTLRRVFEHIGVDDSFAPRDLYARHNSKSAHFDMRVRHFPVPNLVRSAIRRLAPDAIRERDFWKIPIDPCERESLTEIYRPHIAALQDLLGRELPWGPHHR